MIVLGGVVVCVLIQPRRPGEGRRVAELRNAGSPEAIRNLAESRAHGLRRPALPRRARLVLAAAFGFVALTLGTLAHRWAEKGWPPIWVSAIALVLLGLAGYLAYSRAQRPWHWALLVAGSQLLLNAAFSAAAILLAPAGASTADWARILFCYHAGAAPSAAQVSAARASLGPGAAHLLPTPQSAGAGVLVWAALAHLLAAVLLAVYVQSVNRRQDRSGRRDVVSRADRRVPLGDEGRLTTVMHRVEQGMSRPSEREQLASAGAPSH